MPTMPGFQLCEAIKVHAAKISQKITLFATKKRRSFLCSNLLTISFFLFCIFKAMKLLSSTSCRLLFLV